MTEGMDKEKMIIVLGTAHRKREPGKCSPDGSIREYAYSREMVTEIAVKLQSYGYKTVIDMKDDDLPKNMQTPNSRLERSRELGLRVNFVNELCRQNGRRNVLYVSFHIDAAGADGGWHGARGWSVRVSNNASKESKFLAECLFEAAKENGIKTRQPAPSQKYWHQNLYVLNNTQCPAVLTENLFQDNQLDVKLLLSDEGRHKLARLHIEGILRYISKLDTVS